MNNLLKNKNGFFTISALVLLVFGVGINLFNRIVKKNNESVEISRILSKPSFEKGKLNQFNTVYKKLYLSCQIINKLNEGENLTCEEMDYLYRVINRFFTWKLTACLAIKLNKSSIKQKELLDMFGDFYLEGSVVENSLRQFENAFSKIENGVKKNKNAKEMKEYINSLKAG